MLVQGQVYLDGPIAAFHDLAYRFYQVDITLTLPVTPAILSEHMRYVQDALLAPPATVVESTPTSLHSAVYQNAADLYNTVPSVDSDYSVSDETSSLLPTSTATSPVPLHTHSTLSNSTTHMSNLLQLLYTAIPQSDPPERVVVYSNRLVRITFNKHTVPISVVWAQLAQWQQSGVICTYAFRNMEMEEVLSSVIDNSHS